MTDETTTAEYHCIRACIRADVAVLCAKAGFKEAADWWTKMCIYHLALMFFRMGMK
jgi:hypothetical protein